MEKGEARGKDDVAGAGDEVWGAAAAGAAGDAAELADELSRSRADAPGTHPEFDRLVRTVWRLRQPDGCPWDRAQTHESLRRDMVEEAYEAADRDMVEEAYEAADAALEGGAHLAEELGDVLMQVLLNAQVAADAGDFTIDDVCRQINAKLVRRHPHVFGDAVAADAGAVGAIWDDVKRREREGLLQCQKISTRAARAGFEWASVDDVWDQVASERREFEDEERGSEEAAEEFGDVLFSLVNVARWEGIDAEAALDASNRKFRRRWSAMERMAREEGLELDGLGAERLNELWRRAKLEERAGDGESGAGRAE